MNRQEAMDKAVEIVEKIGNNPELNNRGYKIDGWKPPTLAERVAAIETLANFLWEPEPDEAPEAGPLVPPLPPMPA